MDNTFMELKTKISILPHGQLVQLREIIGSILNDGEKRTIPLTKEESLSIFKEFSGSIDTDSLDGRYELYSHLDERYGI